MIEQTFRIAEGSIYEIAVVDTQKHVVIKNEHASVAVCVDDLSELIKTLEHISKKNEPTREENIERFRQSIKEREARTDLTQLENLSLKSDKIWLHFYETEE
jgi:bifunctional DNA-binding transcriptional regulator/antitoxin component of YhaV-PrlF toxin-antitoxin module